MNAQTLQGHWNEIKGQLKQKWGQLSDQDLEFAEGNVDQLIGNIQRKTGESRESIEKHLDTLINQGAAGLSAAAERFQHATHYAGEHLRSGYENARSSFYDQYGEAEDLVRSNPMQSVGTAFGIGVLVGVTLGLLVRQR
ncbi:CsbD family protein [Tautonia sp. JC769]|uniref:CsbD family protein n=1 Tax=Tautonia sp. JC769 TaxID=3232135 RepID=UPI00345A3F8E